MSADDLEIINSALTRTGHNQIESLTDGSAEAEAASANYESVVRAELARYPWSFAKKYKELNRLDGTPDNEWDYKFQLDSDLLKLVVVEHTQQPIPYERHGATLYCDYDDDVFAEYIFRAGESAWAYDFREAITKRMEAIFLRSLAEKYEEAQVRDDAADIDFRLARNEDAKNQTPRDRRTSRLVTVRRG